MSTEEQWLVTRVLDAADGSFEIQVGQPEKVIDDEWRCAYRIGDKTSYAHGLDGLQALLMALTGVRMALDDLGAQLKWRGGKAGDHGVPRLVPHGLGVAFSRKIDAFIDAEIDRFAANAESAAKAKPST